MGHLTRLILGRPDRLHPFRTFFQVASPMRCLDVVRMVVPVRRPHALWDYVVWNDVSAVSERLSTNPTFHILFNNFLGKQCFHCRPGPQFSISSGMMKILNTLNRSARGGSAAGSDPAATKE
jgi:hypothetical protein